MSSSSSATMSKVSFTIRRPTPLSRQGSSGPESDRESSFKVPQLPRHLTDSGRSTPTSPLVNGERSTKSSRSAQQMRINSSRRYDDSSDEEEEAVDEIVTGFDQFGVQRLKETKKEGPMVIPALQNRDWREVARKRKASEMYVPGGAKAATGADGSVGGLGTRDAINTGPVVAGLVKKEKRVKMEVDTDGVVPEPNDETLANDQVVQEETEDEKALRAVLASAKPEEDDGTTGLTIDAIPSGDNAWRRPVDETDAYKQDMLTRPDVATLDDYDRVPVSEFGAALMRGMGWKPGTAASRTRTGLVEPWLPASRPALLGIGAKERVVDDAGEKNGKAKAKTRPEKRYVPLVKRERERDGRGSDGARSESPRVASAPASRRASRSPGPERRRERERDRDYDRRDNRERDRDSKNRDRGERERDRGDRRREKEYDSDRGGRSDRDRDRYGERERDRDRRR